jgi:hypothetical protein
MESADVFPLMSLWFNLWVRVSLRPPREAPIKEMPVWKFNILFKNCAQHRGFNGRGAKHQFELGNELGLAKREYRTKKTLSRPST